MSYYLAKTGVRGLGRGGCRGRVSGPPIHFLKHSKTEFSLSIFFPSKNAKSDEARRFLRHSRLEGARAHANKPAVTRSHPNPEQAARWQGLPTSPSSWRSGVTTLPGLEAAGFQKWPGNRARPNHLLTLRQMKNQHLLHAFRPNAMDNRGESNTDRSSPQKLKVRREDNMTTQNKRLVPSRAQSKGCGRLLAPGSLSSFLGHRLIGWDKRWGQEGAYCLLNTRGKRHLCRKCWNTELPNGL